MSCQRCERMHIEMQKMRIVLQILLQRLNTFIADYEKNTCNEEFIGDLINLHDQVMAMSEGNLPAEAGENVVDAMPNNDGNKVEQDQTSNKLAKLATLSLGTTDELQPAMEKFNFDDECQWEDIISDEEEPNGSKFTKAAQGTQEALKYVTEMTMIETPKKIEVEVAGAITNQSNANDQAQISCGHNAAKDANDANKLYNKNEKNVDENEIVVGKFATQIGLKPEDMKNNPFFHRIKLGKPVFQTYDELKEYEKELSSCKDEVKILRDFYRRFDYRCGHARWLYNVWTALISRYVLRRCGFDATRRKEGIKDTQLVQQMKECFRERYPDKCFLDYKATTLALFNEIEYNDKFGKNNHKFYSRYSYH